MISNRATHFLQLAAKLRVDRKDGLAPHKPLLLLVIAELAEIGQLPSSRLLLTAELTFRFLSFWMVAAARRPQKPDIRLPFFHLWSDGFWLPHDENGVPTQERARAIEVELEEEFSAIASRCHFPRKSAPHFNLPLFRGCGRDTRHFMN